jgi:F0F1-type ATP synthase membrane subunit b/b'
MVESLKSILAAVSLSTTDAVMIVVGTVLIFLLHRVLANSVFAPILEHVEKRESVTTGALFTALQMRQKTDALKARFDEEIFRARVEGNRRASEIVAGAKDQASKILSEAENDAARELQAGRDAIAQQMAKATAAAEVEAKDLATRLSAQVDSQLASN